MIHLQKTVPNWPEAIARLPDKSLFKAVDEGSEFAGVKAINPHIKTVLRHHYDPDQVFGGSWDDNLDRARAFFETFIDGTFKDRYAEDTDYIEEWNEYLANSQNAQELFERELWAEAAAWVWKNEYRVQPELSHIKLVLCNAAVGNWISKRFAEIAQLYDCAIGYHPYDYWSYKVRGDEGLQAALSMLWDTMELDWGITVEWLFTECGPFEAAEEGWRSPKCLGDDRVLYRSAVQQWIWDVQATPAYAQGRIVGFNLFTTGRTDPKWQSFWTEQPELNDLADMVALEWHPGGGSVPPIPPPPPSNELENYLWEVSIEQQAISLNKDAAIQKRIYAHGYVPVMGEYYTHFEGHEYVLQAAEHLGGEPRRVYYARVPDWNNVIYFTQDY
jgi:hypothetical protein